MGWVTLAFSIFPILCIIGVMGHKSASDDVKRSPKIDGIQIYAPSETTWHSLQIFFEQHQATLSKTGILFAYGQASSIPILLPEGFEDWTIEQQTA